MCEHHMLPMICEFTLGYQTEAQILGLSKLVRIVKKHCRGLQVQERIADGILTDLKAIAKTENAGVYVHGLHLCMMMRGVKSPAVAITSSASGIFKSGGAAHSEFEAIARNARAVWPL